MKAKILLLIVAVIFVLGITGGVYLWLNRPQVITFGDGTKLTLLGVEYGKRHALPGGRLPPGSPRIVWTVGPQVNAFSPPDGNGSFTTLNDTLVVWVRAQYDFTTNQPGQPSPYRGFQLSVSDKGGSASAWAASRNMNDDPRGDDIIPILVNAFPRREGKLYLRAQESTSGGRNISDEKFVIANPAAKMSFPKWTPEPVPDAQTNGDWVMTLTMLVAGVNLPYQTNSNNPDVARNKGVQVAFHIERNGKRVTNWQLASVELTDATGNRTGINSWPKGGGPVQWNGGEGTFTYPRGLWPDEPAWKLRLEMTQTSDFSSDEQWTVENIPVVRGGEQTLDAISGMRDISVRGGGGARNNLPPAPIPCAETDLGGHHVKVFPAVQFTNNVRFGNLPANFTPPQTALSIQIQPALMEDGIIMSGANGSRMADDGMRLTLAKVTDAQSGEIQTFSSGLNVNLLGGTSFTSTHRFLLRDLAGVTNISATIALHKNRFFEFTVKPASPQKQ